MQSSRNNNYGSVESEHLLLGILREREGVGAQVLENMGVNLSELEVAL